MTDGYLLGQSAAETQRLQLQARIMAPHSAHLFRLAGISPGMRVLDIGCGAGDVSMLLADLVGPTGSVIGVDRDAAILDQARARVAEAGLANVSFLASDVTDLVLDEPVDALVGRLILIHFTEPAAAVRALTRLVRPGGIVSFQDFNLSRVRAAPPIPSVTAVADWVNAAFRRAGLEPDTGEQLTSILREAGLHVDGAASATAAGGADSMMPEYIIGSARTLQPTLLRFGIATEADVNAIEERLVTEMREAGATAWCPDLVGAWARVP
jgi:SAM-dependent methyltransferase